MIFSRFFTPAHASNNPQTRLQAITKLSPDSANEKRILHELAFNDESAEVSIAALAQLNSFPLWLKMAQIAVDPKVKQAARQQVENDILSASPSIPRGERDEFLLKTASVELVMQVLLHKNISLSDDVVVALLGKVARPAFVQQYFTEAATTALQETIVAQSEDTDFLQKLLRKTQSQPINSVIEHRLEYLKALKQKPIDVERQATLCLSKLKALLDKSDYLVVKDASDTLKSQYNTLSAEFECLTRETVDECNEKYDTISGQVERHLARLLPEFEKLQVEQEKQRCQLTLKAAMAKVNGCSRLLHEQDLMTLTLGQVEEVLQQIHDAEEAIDAYQAVGGNVEDESKRLRQQRAIWDSVPTTQRLCEKLVGLIAEVATKLENKAIEQWEPLQQEWKLLSADMVFVPTEYARQWKALQSQYKAQEHQRKAEQQAHLKHCRKHLNIIGNLVEQGKFRAAISRFAKLQEDYDALPLASQNMLERRFTSTKAQIEQLEGWQSYLAAPRKPELLEQVQGLSTSIADSEVAERARQIRYYRQQWNSLGKTGDSEDDALNQQFDEVLEAAFAPCRAFYANQEANNAKAVAAREELITQLQNIDLQQEPSDIHHQFEAIQQRWNQAQQVSAANYKELKSKWDSAKEPVSALLRCWYDENRQKKQQLIEQVQSRIANQELVGAGDQAKQWQQDWKQIGFAGKRVEVRLWKQFRQENDNLFALIGAKRSEQKAQSKDQAEVLLEQITDLENNLTVLNQTEFEQKIADIQQDFRSLVGADFKAVSKAIEQLSQRFTQYQRERHVASEKKSIDALLAILRSQYQTPSNDIASAWDEIPSVWRAAIESNTQSQPERRHRIVLRMEITAGVDSPDSDNDLRLTEQLTMMQAKLAEGEVFDLSELLCQWLACGPVTNDAELERLKRVIAS